VVNRRRARSIRALVLALVAVLGFALPVSADTILKKLSPRTAPITYTATITHDTNDDCSSMRNWKYKVTFKATLSHITSTQFRVEDAWITYQVTTGTVFTNLFVITGSYDRWPASGTVYQGDYLHGGESKTYYYNTNKTFRKDATLNNRSSFGDPGDCDQSDYWALYVY
jgi:hypothetical protein